MATTQDTIARYLHEAHAMELALVRTLEAHSAMAPTGTYRTLLERHLLETRGHADRIARRLADLGHAESPVETGYGLAQRIVGQLLALGKAPLDLLRGASPEEKLLKNAKDECATEALEIATYDALETLARAAGDDLTARLAADHRADEERTLTALREHLPALTAAVVGASPPPRRPAPARPTAVAAASRAPRRPAARRPAARRAAAARVAATPRRAPATSGAAR
jgi:ferritin-like metal-binding protein YciE